MGGVRRRGRRRRGEIAALEGQCRHGAMFATDLVEATLPRSNYRWKPEVNCVSGNIEQSSQ